MRPFLGYLAFILVLTTACGGDDDGGDGTAGSMAAGASGSAGTQGTAGSPPAAGDADAEEICRQGIDCGYQLADQASCVELYLLLTTAADRAACRACVEVEECATELEACQTACTLQ